MSTPPRSRLIESPPVSAVRWRVVEVDLDGHRARVVPYLAMPVLARELDAIFGVDGWNNRYRPFGRDSVGCELAIGTVVKSVIVRGFSGRPDHAELAAAGLTSAAIMHGVALPVAPDADSWVDWDPEEQEPLYWPDAQEAVGTDRLTSPQDLGHTSSREAVSMDESPSIVGSNEPPVTDTAAEPVDSAPTDAGQAPIKSEGQRAIDKLVDRLREAGHGLEAARLVTGHKGYGNDPDAARMLYARLRQLLLEGDGS